MDQLKTSVSIVEGMVTTRALVLLNQATMELGSRNIQRCKLRMSRHKGTSCVEPVILLTHT